MNVVPRAAPRLTIAAQAAAVVTTLRAATGRVPPRTLARVLLAQLRFESDDHPANNNPGNLSAAGFFNGAEITGWAGDAWRPPWFEPPGEGSQWANLHALMVAGKEPSAFRSYPTLEAGLRDWFALLVHRYRSLLDAAGEGDLQRFGELYASSGYCPNCKPGAVRAAIERRLLEADSAGAWEGIELAPDPPRSASAPVIALVATVTAAVLFWATVKGRRG